MGRFIEEIESKGFIKDIFNQLQQNLNSEQLKNFTNLESDEARYRFVSQYECMKQITLTPSSTLKNIELSLDFKAKGNKAFQDQHWLLALDFYNKSILLMPAEKVEDFSIVLANRSAALYRMEKFDLAIQDIEVAEENYPKEMMYKLKERTARCYLAKKSYEMALISFKETVKHLDESKLPMEKRGKLERNAQIMIKMLPQQIEHEKKMKKVLPEKSLNLGHAGTKLNKSVELNYNEREGRFMRTSRNMKVGEEVLVEKAVCATLMEKFSKSHCQHCFARTITPLACFNCIDVIFCSKQCRNASTYSYHKYECGLLQTLWNSGSSINYQMAMRLISQRLLSYFRSIRDQLKETISIDEISKLPSHDYRRVYSLVCHEKDRPVYSFLQYTFMSAFLVKFLEVNHYFDSDISGKTGSLCDDDKVYIGSLIMRNLQVLQFNSHEVFDLLKGTADRQTVAIGAGLYTTLALFNHSCNPTVVRYFKNTDVHVVSICNLKSGQKLSENYGPLYQQTPKEERQKQLKKFYWYDCQCDACEQNWPVFDDMNTNEIKFKM